MDWKNPDYQAIFAERLENLANIRRNPQLLPALKMHYRNNPADFINDWGVTFDPRLAERGLPTLIPMILFPKQVEFIEWVMQMWGSSKPGIAEKSRDMGLSVICQQLGATLCLFNPGISIGYGSRKEDLVDKAGDPDTLFYKGRMFLEHLPPEFRGGFDARNKAHTSHLKIEIPETGSIMKGEAGDNIGRGGRSSIYFDDESAFQPRPLLIDAALSQTTNCRISVSSVNGTDNPFAEKRFAWPAEQVFTFHWRDDPRKDDAWYRRQCESLSPLIVAQEIDLNYSASKSGILIPSEWVQAAVNAHEVLGFEPTGERRGAFDVADEGIDLCAWADRHGVVLQHVEAWSGIGSDTFASTAKVFMIADDRGVNDWEYDGDGLGTGVKGDARVLNENRKHKQQVAEFRGSGAVINPDKVIIQGDNKRDGRTNKDFFKNRKAQAWWQLRMRFQLTYRAVVEGMAFDKDEIISIDKKTMDARAFTKLIQELSQPTYSLDGSGKIIVDKAPEGSRSPNHADAVMMVYSQRKRRSGF